MRLQQCSQVLKRRTALLYAQFVNLDVDTTRVLIGRRNCLKLDMSNSNHPKSPVWNSGSMPEDLPTNAEMSGVLQKKETLQLRTSTVVGLVRDQWLIVFKPPHSADELFPLKTDQRRSMHPG